MKEYIVELTEDEVIALYYVSGLTPMGDVTAFGSLFEILDDIIHSDINYGYISPGNVFDIHNTSTIFKCKYIDYERIYY